MGSLKQLLVVDWRVATRDSQVLVVEGGWQWVVVGWWWFATIGGWGLVLVDGGRWQRLAIGGLWGWFQRGFLTKKNSFLKDPSPQHGHTYIQTHIRKYIHTYVHTCIVIVITTYHAVYWCYRAFGW